MSRNVTQGQTVASSLQTPTLFLIATDLTKMQVDTNVSESDIGGVKNGNTASFTVEAYPEARHSRARSRRSASLRRPCRSRHLRRGGGVDNTDLALMPGMTATTKIITDQRDDVLRVPDQALRYRPAASGAGRWTGIASLGLARRQADAGRRSPSGSTTTVSPKSSSGDLKPVTQ